MGTWGSTFGRLGKPHPDQVDRSATRTRSSLRRTLSCSERWSVLRYEGALNDESDAVAMQYATVPGAPSTERPVSVAVQARPPNKIVLELVAMVKQ